MEFISLHYILNKLNIKSKDSKMNSRTNLSQLYSILDGAGAGKKKPAVLSRFAVKPVRLYINFAQRLAAVDPRDDGPRI